jgi:hypothetical protein
MKVKSEGYYHAFGPVKLYREELDEIVSLINAACESVELSAGKYIFDSLDEMATKLGKQFHQLHIEGRTPYISVRLGTHYFFSWARRDRNLVSTTDDGQGLFFLVKNVISSHERNVLRRLFSFPVYFLVLTIDILFSLFRHFYLHLSSGTNHVVRVTAAIPYYCYLVCFGYCLIRGASFVTLKSRYADDTFIRRNLDKFATLIFGAILGVLGTLVAEWLKHRLFQQ